eukprot:8338481-Ditylum_brightwellii.AAC.1
MSRQLALSGPPGGSSAIADLRCTTANKAALVRKIPHGFESNWRIFRQLVDRACARNDLPPGEKYLTRDSIDIFFLHDVQHCLITPASASKFRPALQWYADLHDYVTEAEKFNVSSPSVISALEAQQGK